MGTGGTGIGGGSTAREARGGGTPLVGSRCAGVEEGAASKGRASSAKEAYGEWAALAERRRTSGRDALRE